MCVQRQAIDNDNRARGVKLRNKVYLIFLFLNLLCTMDGLSVDERGLVTVDKIKLQDPGSIGPGFTLLNNRSLKVDFQNKLNQAEWLNNQNLLNGAGVALGDYDKDGHCDIYLCSLSGGNKLYRNLGDWKFVDATDPQTACEGAYSTGAGFADLNGDGWLDLLVLAMGSNNKIFLNDGRGGFNEPTLLPGNDSRLSGSTSFAIGDLDGDSDPDLYIANYGYKSIIKDGGKITINTINGRDVVGGSYAKKLKIIDGQIHEFGEIDDILINDGKANFHVKKWEDTVEGIGNNFPYRDQGLSVAFRDLNNDMAPEIIVANDGHPDRFFQNKGKGSFKNYSSAQIRHLSYNSMGLDFADIDRDSLDDLVVVEMLATGRTLRMTQDKVSFPKEDYIANRNSNAMPQAGRNMLYKGRGDMTFNEVGYMMGLAASDWSWSSIFLDVDLDGFEDLLVTNGFEFDADDWDMQARLSRLKNLTPTQRKKSILLYPKLNTPNLAFQNQAGFSFVEKGSEWGFESLADGHGMACGDLDNDGDLDLVVNNLNSSVSIYRNDCASPRLAVELMGQGENTSGTGARLIVEGHEVDQSQEMISGGRYMSCDQSIRVFAAKQGSLHKVTVRWRSGHVSVINKLEAGYKYLIRHPSGPPSTLPVARSIKKIGVFSQSRVLDHRGWPSQPVSRLQPGLPFDVGRMDPSVLAVDMDGEFGLDLVVSEGGKGITVFLSDDNGRFDEGKLHPWPSLGLIPSGPDLKGSFLALTRPPKLLNWSGGELITGQELKYSGEPQCAVFFDYDSDGDSDLFVGGGSAAGQYPVASRSVFFENRSGTFILSENQKLFSYLSLVTDADSADMDGDGTEDLVVAQEWGAVRIFLNRNGVFEDSTQGMGLDKYTGLWQCAHIADVNGDGRQDIVAGNFGLNTVYEIYEPPVRLSYLDSADGGAIGALEFHYDKESSGWFSTRKYAVATAVFPLMAHRILTSAKYASMNMEQIMGDDFQSFEHKEFNFLASVVFLNNGDGFSVQVLPDEIQASPVFGVCSGDFNGDKKLDLFFAQNFFGVPEKFSRYDSGQGSMILAGKDGFSKVLDSDSSGVQLLGEQRSPISIDLNGDGRLDIVLAERDGGVVLLENRVSR